MKRNEFEFQYDVDAQFSFYTQLSKLQPTISCECEGFVSNESLNSRENLEGWLALRLEQAKFAVNNTLTARL